MRASLRVVVTLLVVAAAVLAGIWLWRYYMLSPWTRDARVRADVVVVAPDVSGWVTDLEVKDNQVVKVGDVLMRIDQERYQANLSRPAPSPRPVTSNTCCARTRRPGAAAWASARSAPRTRKTPRSMPPSLAASTRRRWPR